jgi:glutamate synthase (NADPH/NADH)
LDHISHSKRQTAKTYCKSPVYADRMGLAVEAIHGKYIEQEEQIEQEYTPYQPVKGQGYGWAEALPEKQGLYDPSLEKDACGVGFAA